MLSCTSKWKKGIKGSWLLTFLRNLSMFVLDQRCIILITWKYLRCRAEGKRGRGWKRTSDKSIDQTDISIFDKVSFRFLVRLNELLPLGPFLSLIFRWKFSDFFSFITTQSHEMMTWPWERCEAQKKLQKFISYQKILLRINFGFDLCCSIQRTE